jgi:hypothetical protein
MTNLTLEQVRKAGRMAWRDDGYWVCDGRTVRPTGILYGRGVDDAPRTGWHHLHGCDC